MTSNKRKKKKGENNFDLYAVSHGHKTGIFKNWLSCAPNVNKVPGAIFKGFNNLEEAKKWLVAENVNITFNDCSAEEFEKADGMELDDTCFSQSSFGSFSDPIEGTSNRSPLKRKTPTSRNLNMDSDSTYLMIIQQSEKIDRLESIINHQTSLISNLTRTIKEIVEKNLSTFRDSIFQQCNNERSFANALKHGPSTSTSIPASTKIPQPIPINSKDIHPAPRKDSNRHPSEDLKMHTRNNKHSTPFKPKQSVVISVTDKKSLSVSESDRFNPDIIRRAICEHFGPTLIEKVSPYHFNSNKPKVIVQLKDENSATTLVNNWSSHILNGSEVRNTINPLERDKNSVMMKGVPLDYDHKTMEEEICSVYPCTKVMRLTSKDGRLLRTVKLQFQNDIHLQNSLKYGITLTSQSLICHCEQIIHNGF